MGKGVGKDFPLDNSGALGDAPQAREKGFAVVPTCFCPFASRPPLLHLCFIFFFGLLSRSSLRTVHALWDGV